MNMIREIKQYQATDGTCFGTRVEAEEYEEMLQNPHFKKLQERIEHLEHEILGMKAEIATLHSAPARSPLEPFGPYQRPQAMLNHKVYNPATGGEYND